jgi:DNA polymerase-3 subunit delta'
VWEGLVGQERAIAALERAAARPAHAYLLVGPDGSGVELAARGFATLLLGGADERTARLVQRGMHPDVVEFEPAGASYRVQQDVRDRILPEAARAPVEAERKVLVLFEAERLRGNQNEPANALLKTLEEPPPRTVLVLVTSAPDDLLDTIRSRCQRIDLDPVTDDALRATLVDEGVAPDTAALAAALAGGQLARARALAGPIAELREAFASVPARADGTGATAYALAEELLAAVDAAAEHVARQHAAELTATDEEMERLGYSDRDAQRIRRRVEERHKREARRARIDLLLEGVTAIESVYRDALAAPAPAVNLDRPPLALSPRAAVAALDACRAAREAVVVHEKGPVRLQYLVLSLPPAATVAAR